jgi:FkbM family methyltransferase
MLLFRIIKFIWNHPLSADGRVLALGRFIRWQMGSRILKTPIIYPWMDEARLLVQRGMTAATGNIYVGLVEFEEMAFTLHYLRSTDVFFDIGANIGVYTVLVAKVIGARCLSVEPVPEVFNCLMDNIYLNRIQDRIDAFNIGVGKGNGKLHFTVTLGAVNRVVSKEDAETPSTEVAVSSLDDISGDMRPEMIKIDVEGFEQEVVAGGKKTLADPSVNVVIMELRGHGERYGFDDHTVDKQMRAFGFEAYFYDPFTRCISLRAEDRGNLGDMLYIRNIAKAHERVASSRKYKISGKDL